MDHGAFEGGAPDAEGGELEVLVASGVAELLVVVVALGGEVAALAVLDRLAVVGAEGELVAPARLGSHGRDEDEGHDDEHQDDDGAEEHERVLVEAALQFGNGRILPLDGFLFILCCHRKTYLSAR